MAAQASYKSTLTDASLKKAEEELNEYPNERLAQLKQFTDWIEQEKKWLTAPTDPVYLLSFLRVRKFSQLMARESLVNSLIIKGKEMDIFKKIDYDDPKIQAALRTGYILPLPKRDQHDRKVCLIRTGKLDISGKVKMLDICRAMVMVQDYLLMDETTQVNGIVIILDYMNVTMKHQLYIGEWRKKFFGVFPKCYPFRFKAVYMCNVGSFLELILGVSRSVLKEKLQKRIEIFSSMVGIYDKVGQSALPLDYQPDDYTGESPGTCDTILENVLAELGKPEVKKWTKLLSSGKYKVDEKKMPSRADLFREAFRTKLNID